MSRRAFAVLILMILIIGWSVYDSTTFYQSITGPEKLPAKSIQEQIDEQSAGTVTTPDGQVQYLAIPSGFARFTDTVNDFRFYYPEEWDRKNIKVQKLPVTEDIQGKQFGSDSAKYLFDSKNGNWTKLANAFTAKEYSTKVGDHSASFGLEGNSSGAANFIVFTDGTNAYMLEGPVVPISDKYSYDSKITNASQEVFRGIRFLQ
jgi:hypothetical protein